jgi:hypothetical protein
MLTAYEIPGTQFSLPATTAIGRYRFVSIDATGQAIQATASTDVIGVSRNEIDPVKYPDAQVVDIADGIMMVEAAGEIACGAKVASDANGKAVEATDVSVGIAFSSAATAGTLVAVKLGYASPVGIDGTDGTDGKTLQTVLYTSADLTADADLTNVPIGMSVGAGTIVEATIISMGAAEGIDADNTSVFKLSIGETEIAAKTFNDSEGFPAAGVGASFAIDKAAIDSGDILLLSVTNGTAVNLPIFMVQVVVELN